MSLDEFLKDAGIKANELTDELKTKIEAEKAKLDTETRRKVRKFWIGVSVVAFCLGIGAGYLLF
ncbi:MAG: hypothetical protein Q4E62_08290 [Sutterellaceae bacterium]|nr:hypothetical protein [Sutterellaceae bacterium]